MKILVTTKVSDMDSPPAQQNGGQAGEFILSP